MSSEQDWQEFRDAIRITREIMHQPALDNYRGREISPGAECQSDAELDEFVRNHAETAFHPCGTCKMGYDEMAVVDGEGRVHGGREPLAKSTAAYYVANGAPVRR